MDDDSLRWQRAGALFDELVELAPSEQRARVVAIEREDAPLARLVRELLAADAQPEGVLGEPAGALAPSLIEALARSPRDAAAGGARYETIGPYRVLGTIGTGGMGEVLLAERADGHFEQRVAIKLLKRGMDSDGVLKRFLQERRILARLAHPNIARLLDGGMTTDGVPYFVMEYVEGQPITAFAHEWRLGLRQRIELMLHVCAAVEFAHRNLVVHRDLKPSNILVDGSGGLKLLDFGIAKVLTEDSEETMTEAGMRVMTLAYAAPEQILGEPITTATDVYALGVLLFELLTGQLPHDRGKRPIDALASEVSRESVERPSAALRHALQGEGSPRERARRARALEGDLDTIALSALHREPERRYGSAAAFANDLKRWLDGRPIAARRDSRWYRARKFMRRHQVGVAAVAAIVLTLIGGLGSALWQAQLARQYAARAEVEARRAESEARHAARTKDFVVDLIGRINPYETTRGAELSAVQLLEIAAAQLDEGLKDAPEAQAELRAAIAQTLFRLGATAEAQALIDRAVEQLRGFGPVYAVSVANALTTQAKVHSESGDLDGAARMNQEALELLERAPGDNRRGQISALTGLARIANTQGRSEDALAMHERIVPLRRALVGDEDADVAMDYQNLAASYLAIDRFADAEASYKRASVMLTRLLGPDHPRLLYIWHGLGTTLLKRGRYEEAEVALQRARAMQDRSLKPDTPIIATTRQVLAQLYFWQGRYPDAERELDAAYASAAPIKSPTLPYIEWVRARLYLATGRATQAIAAADAAIGDLAAMRSAEDPLTLQVRGLAALARFRAGERETGEHELRVVLAALEAGSGPHAEELAEVCEFLAQVRSAQGDREEARALYDRALAAYGQVVDDEHPRVRAIRAASGLLQEHRDVRHPLSGSSARARGRRPLPVRRAC